MSTETEIELGKVVAFPAKNNDLQDGLVIQREGKKVMCLHSTVLVNEKDRTLRCRKCETLIEPFDFLMTLCDQESRYMESVKYLRREEKQRRQNIEKLIQIEKNAKSRIRRAGDKSPLPLWQNERVDE
ncbi:hypothetical protein FKC81_19845 [Klebsiella pneumoniae]|uniref:hypothetical protein n=1 Tax=Klebsiella pneumoniae TaxID=573 RepID=UPI000B9557B2|nr:hypothetical protein [Klebsiella pneumoniae]MBK5710754.1 hypothetical protein [Klebsiella pneumoniae]OYJ34613.1 hypothetical protein CI739_10420 [Klebsiella pneumoniae subsp. pneumoniae]PLL26632.1 hypothetical protein CWN22_08925 [Klebsiella pneumoniae]PLO97175.1 hypothetical protein CWN14_25900 [Klebsiella pneumoniae]TQC56858.1 hypothetical protein FKC81_19845 [Klebsiella pneumoniae]